MPSAFQELMGKGVAALEEDIQSQLNGILEAAKEAKTTIAAEVTETKRVLDVAKTDVSKALEPRFSAIDGQISNLEKALNVEKTGRLAAEEENKKLRATITSMKGCFGTLAAELRKI